MKDALAHVVRDDRLPEPQRQHEAQAAAKLVHANIVQIHEVGCIDGTYFIAQEYTKAIADWQKKLATAADDTSPEVKSYIDDLKTHYGDEIAGAGPSVFTYGYYTGMTALIKGLEAVNGDVSDQAKLQEALAGVTLSGEEAPWGDVKLDDNRQAISDVYVKKIVKDANGDGVPDVQTFRRIPEVDQTFNGVFSADTPAPDDDPPGTRSGSRISSATAHKRSTGMRVGASFGSATPGSPTSSRKPSGASEPVTMFEESAGHS